MSHAHVVPHVGEQSIYIQPPGPRLFIKHDSVAFELGLKQPTHEDESRGGGYSLDGDT